MRLKTIGCCLLILLGATVHAQVKTMVLNGYLAMEGGESFTYKLFIRDSADLISGYSISYTTENLDTKSTIRGYVDRQNQTLTFIENDIIYNHGFRTHVQLCLVNAKLQYQPANKGHVLKGPFSSINAANTFCTGGSITFINDNAFDSLFTDYKPVVPEHKVIKMPFEQPGVRSAPRRTIVSQSGVPHPAVISNEPDEVTAGTDKVYDWSSDTVVIAVWDGGHIDDDIITLRYNDQTLLARYTLKATKKELRIPLTTNKVDTLTIIAVNEGNEPPNTANVLLTDGTKQYNLVAYNSMGQIATIKIRRQRKN